MKTIQHTLKHASFGSVSTGTLRTEDLLSAFIREVEWQIARNGAYLSQPENFAMRDRLAALIGVAQDCFAEDGETIADESGADWSLSELQDALQEFAAPYSYFGTLEGDGADFGFWPDIESARESCEFVSSKEHEFPADDFRGEWLHINERGNCTLYVREDPSAAGNHMDREVWSIV